MTNKEILRAYNKKMNELKVNAFLSTVVFDHAIMKKEAKSHNHPFLEIYFDDDTVEKFLSDEFPETSIKDYFVENAHNYAQKLIKKLRRFAECIPDALPKNAPESKKEKELRDKIHNFGDQLKGISDKEEKRKQYNILLELEEEHDLLRRNHLLNKLLIYLNFDEDWWNRHEHLNDDKYFEDLALLCKNTANEIEKFTKQFLEK